MQTENLMEDKHPGWFERLSHLLLREPKDREQLMDLLRDAGERNLFDQHALAMMEGVLQVSEMQVRDIMIPRPQMIVLSEENTLEELLPLVIESGHSRFPVTGEDPNQIIGILLAKDLLAHLSSKEKSHAFKLKENLRPAAFIPESKRLNTLLEEFRVKHHHMAIIVDEYGSTAGLVTIEDVLEQIVGEIEDEHDFDEETYIKKHSETTYIIKAITPIEEFNHYFQTHFNQEEFDTIGGLVLNAFGRFPKRGENIIMGNFRFKVLHADNRRIRLLRVRKIKIS
jgi:magnesium and cobalt transporter